MSDILLYGRNTSVNVQKAIWALEELGLAYAREDVGGPFRGTDTPEYIAMNPMQRVPTLRDGDLVVWESHAVVRYIAAKYGAGGLWPETPEARAVVDQWTDWTAAHFQPAWLAVFQRVVLTPPSKRDAGAVKAAVADADGLYAILDRRLAEVPFLGGDALTYADIIAGSSLYRWTTMEIERAIHPAVEAWHKRLLDRPAFVTSVNVSFEAMKAKD